MDCWGKRLGDRDSGTGLDTGDVARGKGRNWGVDTATGVLVVREEEGEVEGQESSPYLVDKVLDTVLE